MTPTLPTLLQALRERTFDENESWRKLGEIMGVACVVQGDAIELAREQFTADQKIIEKLCRALELAVGPCECATLEAQTRLSDDPGTTYCGSCWKAKHVKEILEGT